MPTESGFKITGVVNGGLVKGAEGVPAGEVRRLRLVRLLGAACNPVIALGNTLV